MQLHVLGEQLNEQTSAVEMLQASEAALKADLAAMRDDRASGVAPAAMAAVEAADAGAGDTPDKGKVKKNWGDRVKEMKEKAAEKAKAAAKGKKAAE